MIVRFLWLLQWKAALSFAFSTSHYPSSVSSSSASRRLLRNAAVANENTILLTDDKTYSEEWAVVDGAEWRSIERHLTEQGLWETKTFAGALCFATGTTTDGEQVVGLRSSAGDKEVFANSVAQIPRGVSPQQAISTMRFGWALHCLFPIMEGIGGSAESSMTCTKPGTVVVVGSSDYAQMAARALAALDCQVKVVTSKALKFDDYFSTKIETLRPSDDDGVGFADQIGKFDALLDTLGDEAPLVSSFGGVDSVLDVLKSEHGCSRYVSTVTEQQTRMEQGGIFGGPGQAKQHVQKLVSSDILRPPAPRELGRTIQSLLEAGITWSTNKLPMVRTEVNGESANIRGWTLGDYWEGSTWPRDIDSNARFGFPSAGGSLWLEDEDEDEDEFVAKPDVSERRQTFTSGPRTPKDKATALEAVAESQESNPNNILQFTGVHGLGDYIVDAELDSCLFLSAQYCRTCRYLHPQFQRLARLQKSKTDIVFSQADATGDVGKELGRSLGVESVPSFILFRGGKMFGAPMSISKFPSDMLNRALQYLEEGRDWDAEAILGKDSEGSIEGRSFL